MMVLALVLVLVLDERSPVVEYLELDFTVDMQYLNADG